jgi:integrating conjugative element protein (TIGR03756 family)
MGWGQSSTNDPHDLDTHFKEVDVVGNPAITALGALGFLLLPSTATSFVPYYSSLSDASIWRSTWTEMFYPASIIPGMNEVGSFPLNDWGSVYPRTGFINQPNDAKASAVIAQRAIDIVTKTTQPHIYNPLKTGSCGDHCTVLAVKENDGNTGQFQMIYPTAENRCSVFGENDVLNPTPWKSNEAQKGNGNYVWVLWRHYEGCIKGTGKYIGQISW